MRQSDVTAALTEIGSYPTRCDAAAVVMAYLDAAIERGHWWERQVLREQRGYVRRWMVLHCRRAVEAADNG